ncbi:MAG: metal-sensing transcriptional repressor [bacterium]|nr:metal-sensing transcriptional repressor [bacterium]
MTSGKKSADKTLISLKKAQSLISKIITMKEEGRYCIDIMQQNLAVIGFLRSINQNLLEHHLNSCFKSVMNSNNASKQKQMIEEILQLNKLSNK